MSTFLNIRDMVVVIRGGGDLASGIACRLFESGFRPIMTELEKPKTVRRTVSFSSAVFEKEVVIEGIETNRDFLFDIIKDPNFIRGKFDTSFIKKPLTASRRGRRFFFFLILTGFFSSFVK